MRAHQYGKATCHSQFWELERLSPLFHKSMPGIFHYLLFSHALLTIQILGTLYYYFYLKTRWFSPCLCPSTQCPFCLLCFFHLHMCKNTNPLWLSSRFAIWEVLSEPDRISHSSLCSYSMVFHNLKYSQMFPCLHLVFPHLRSFAISYSAWLSTGI